MTARIVSSEDPSIAGNWYTFPPPEAGFYDLRQLRSRLDGQVQNSFDLYTNRRIYEGGGRRLLCMSRRVSRMRPEDGWSFRFLPQTEGGIPVNWRPFAIIYDLSDPGHPKVTSRQDISNQLPLARSKQEAFHIVRLIPERWPLFVKIHVEYQEEKVQG